MRDAFDFPDFVPAYMRPLFCLGKGPFRSVALSGDPEDIYETDAKIEGDVPGRRAAAPLAGHGAQPHRVPGAAGAHLLGGAGRAASTAVLDGRFKGGYITRRYGDPAGGVHAVQLELAQCTYMDEAYPFGYDDRAASRVQSHLRTMLETMLEFVQRR